MTHYIHQKVFEGGKWEDNNLKQIDLLLYCKKVVSKNIIIQISDSNHVLHHCSNIKIPWIPCTAYLEALPVNYRWTRFIILCLCNPHLHII